MKAFQQGKIISALLLAAVLFFTSCKKDKSEEIPTGSAQKLEKISIGEDFLNFVYNADGTLKQAIVKDEFSSGGDVVTYTITYDAQKRMSQVSTSEGEKLFPVYVNNQLAKVEVKDNANTLIGITEYTYEGSLLKTATVRTNLTGPMIDLMKFEFAYNAAGNISKTSYFFVDPVNGGLDPDGYVTYEYDNKQNPLAAVKEFLKLIWYVPSNNNILKEVHVDANAAVEETVEYNYSYNARNLPQSGTVKRTVPGTPVENLPLRVMYK